jgi:hypothetical protein
MADISGENNENITYCEVQILYYTKKWRPNVMVKAEMIVARK